MTSSGPPTTLGLPGGPLSPALKGALRRHEDKWRDEPIEHLALFDHKGTLLVQATGDDKTVAIPYTKEPLAGTAYADLHNHPGDWVRDPDTGKTMRMGGTFSPDDIQATLFRKLGESRVVGPEGVYRMSPAGGGRFQSSDRQRAAEAGWRISMKVQEEYRRRYAGQSAQAKAVRDFRNSKMWDEVMRRLAYEMEWDYSFEPYV